MKPSEFWNDSSIEREFEESGLQCCTRAVGLGHRCGYVALTKEHPLYGKSWETAYDIAPDLEVDGGITFAQGTDDMWILGWDAGHSWHRPDPSIASEEHRQFAERRFDYPCDAFAIMVDADMAEHETRQFARQLAELCEGVD